MNGTGAFRAGASLLPFSLLIPLGSAVAAIIVGRIKMRPIYLMLTGAILHIVGLVGLSQTPTSFDVWAPQYGFQFLLELALERDLRNVLWLCEQNGSRG